MKEQIINRLKKNFKHRAKWARRNGFEAYRVYEKDLPDFPFLVDIYKNYAVVHFKGKKEIDEVKGHDQLLLDAIEEVCEIPKDNIIYKERRQQDDEFKYAKSNEKGIEFVINEGDLKFIVNLTKYIDTGLFLDHRPLRQKLIKEAEGKKVLNLFCYTGSLSVASAMGASSVTSIDMSNTYLDWAEENFKLNNLNLENHFFYREDVFKFFEKNKEKNNEFYDLIIMDPPTFSQSKKMEGTLDIQRDHIELIKKCTQILKKGGKLYFSNNLRSFKLDDELFRHYNIKELTKWSIPEDFKDMKIHCLYEIMKKDTV
ncbi:class I SAM-dependent methyltransferase [Bacteriovorax sp. Seq25_V]|uniref:class I SAM-dependent methyltransferase n=1 Tax=Bacteriovorax sp. Seq25_V TaxID=1201288 RepID=UPI00038A3729|nr:class I SAM-dependent methyltransferase [Bacteriovorax sp. Seq25_V]EQC44251.1 RNA cap guanine-N2 methyltransferase [Bacteriovorax sp. Seq25_V]